MMVAMLFALIRDYYLFAGVLLRSFIADLLLRRGDDSLMTYGLLGSSLTLCFATHPCLRLVSGATLFVCVGYTLPYVRMLHRAFFCCGLDWSRSLLRKHTCEGEV